MYIWLSVIFLWCIDLFCYLAWIFRDPCHIFQHSENSEFFHSIKTFILPCTLCIPWDQRFFCRYAARWRFAPKPPRQVKLAEISGLIQNILYWKWKSISDWLVYVLEKMELCHWIISWYLIVWIHSAFIYHCQYFQLQNKLKSMKCDEQCQALLNFVHAKYSPSGANGIWQVWFFNLC